MNAAHCCLTNDISDTKPPDLLTDAVDKTENKASRLGILRKPGKHTRFAGYFRRDKQSGVNVHWEYKGIHAGDRLGANTVLRQGFIEIHPLIPRAGLHLSYIGILKIEAKKTSCFC